MTVSSRRNGNHALPSLAAAAAAMLVLGCEQGATPAVSADQGALAVDHVIPTGQSCSPTGKHFEHRAFACTTCHQCAGTLSFDAALAGSTAAFDAGTKTCSSVKCHGVPAGTFTYMVWDWGAEALVPVSVPYGGSGGATANWYALPGAGSCSVCHGFPPRYDGVAYTWHSGTHGYGTSNGNACQLCHPDASGAYVYGGPPSYVSTSGGLVSSCAPGTYCSAGGTITSASLHGNGVVDVTPGWSSSCMGCH